MHSAQVDPIHAGAIVRSPRAGAYNVVRVAVGGLLLIAAVLKAVEPSMPSLTSRLLVMSQIFLECSLAAWLLSGIAPHTGRFVALIVFAGFAGIVGWKLLSGEESCNCFGRLEVPPMYTLGLDVVVIVALALARRRA